MTSLVLPVGKAATFRQIKRSDLIEAGRILGLARASVERELERMLAVILAKADGLIDEIDSGFDKECADLPDIDVARRYFVGESRVLRAIRNIVLAEMCERLLSKA